MKRGIIIGLALGTAIVVIRPAPVLAGGVGPGNGKSSYGATQAQKPNSSSRSSTSPPKTGATTGAATGAGGGKK